MIKRFIIEADDVDGSGMINMVVLLDEKYLPEELNQEELLELIKADNISDGYMFFFGNSQKACDETLKLATNLLEKDPRFTWDFEEAVRNSVKEVAMKL